MLSKQNLEFLINEWPYFASMTILTGIVTVFAFFSANYLLAFGMFVICMSFLTFYAEARSAYDVDGKYLAYKIKSARYPNVRKVKIAAITFQAIAIFVMFVGMALKSEIIVYGYGIFSWCVYSILFDRGEAMLRDKL